MNENKTNVNKTHNNIEVNAEQSTNNNGSGSASDISTISTNLADTGNLDKSSSTIELTAYKELYEQQKQEIEVLKKEINAVKLQNQKLAIQQNVGSPRITAEELINKMFQ